MEMRASNPWESNTIAGSLSPSWRLGRRNHIIGMPHGPGQGKACSSKEFSRIDFPEVQEADAG